MAPHVVEALQEAIIFLANESLANGSLALEAGEEHHSRLANHGLLAHGFPGSRHHHHHHNASEHHDPVEHHRTVMESFMMSTSDLGPSLLMDACVVIFGLTLWKCMRCFRISGPARGSRGDEPSLCNPRAGLQSTVARNYILFLKSCRDTFVALTILSCASVIPKWGPGPLGVGLLGPRLSTTANLDDTGLAILCLETFVRGLVALVVVERLQRKIQKPMLSSDATDSIQRTLWLSDLPVYDRETGKNFEFATEDFEQVAQDLETAINKEFRKRTHGNYTPAKMQVHVAPVVDQWYQISLQLRTAQERQEVYRSLMRHPRRGCCSCCKVMWYTRLFRRYSKQAHALEEQLNRIEKGAKRISGTAFITFENARHRDYFLKNKPRCWRFQHHTFFSFGRPPFASATLACSRAPHPDDVNWTHLHVSQLYQRFWFAFLTICLFVFMIMLVTPVTITSQLQVIIAEVEAKLEKFANRTHSTAVMDMMEKMHGGWAGKLTNQAPAVILVAINSLLLPELIYRISVWVKTHRKSSMEVIQLHLNATFLILNSLVIPFLEMRSIRAALEWAEVSVSRHPQQMVDKIAHRLTSDTMMHSTGIFALRYIMNCASLTNTNSLLQIPQMVSRWHARRQAKTAREHVDAEEAWVFAWGYWYAWTISIFTLGICMSTAVPSTLPCTAFFFTMQHIVDRYNLTYRIYQHGPDIETENLLATRVLHYMRCIIAGWWFVMGIVFLFYLQTELADTWPDRSLIPIEWVRAMACALIGASVLLVIFSWYTQLSILHDNQFHSVNISERGLSSTGGGILQPLFTSIEDCLQCNCCKKKPKRDDGDLSVRSGYDRVPTAEAEAAEAEVDSNLTDAMEELQFPERIHSGVSESEEGGGPLCWDARTVIIQPVARTAPL